MIRKFRTIGNLAVFQNFEWDNSVIDGHGTILEFKQINIFYGRNYSGKTTLSRILRAIERGRISEKFENPAFTVQFSDAVEINQDSLVGHTKKVRVFNDDFVRDNLKFIINPDENIEPFAILGIDNNRIENEIKAIEEEVGSNKEGEESGLNLQLKNENASLVVAEQNLNTTRGQLNNQLATKATGRDTGIKYKPDKFGDQNYNINKLLNDISKVLQTSYRNITIKEQAELEVLISERVLAPIPTIQAPSLSMGSLSTSAEALIIEEVVVSNKIQQLVKDAILNKWVKDGVVLHKDNHIVCAFCNSEIKNSRWSELEQHFDEESERLEKNIKNKIVEVENEIRLISSCSLASSNLFYSKFHSDLQRISTLFNYFAGKYISQLSVLKKQLEGRKEDILNPRTFQKPVDYTKRMNWIFGLYNNIRVLSDSYSNTISPEQSAAREKLRFKEVSDFLTTINYATEQIQIDNLSQIAEGAKRLRDKTADDIIEKVSQIENKRRELKDESKGAGRVNEYLNNFFGHNFLSLKAVEFISQEDTIPTKRFRFEVIRDEKKAYHLSEGECSLIAFCYFMAKLEDIDTKGGRPIIWIDDPISSLDGNHIFFIYSILNSEIVQKDIAEQLFISTHNLDFLKYLKRLTGSYFNSEGKKHDYTKCYFLINRQDKVSKIIPMPKYLREFVTEFNYLFHQIFACSKIEVVDDSNYTTFYNFGNNARKFLEVYLYYKYPDGSEGSEKLEKFFGIEKIPAILTDRINNEYSHLSGVFERGAVPVEVPEMKLAADLIIRRIKEMDEEQYKSLLSSIGEAVN